MSHLPFQPVLTGLFRESAFRKSVMSSVSCIPWVIIRIEIKNEKRASRLGDKFDRSMTFGKLLENNTTLFIFIS